MLIVMIFFALFAIFSCAEIEFDNACDEKSSKYNKQLCARDSYSSSNVEFSSSSEELGSSSSEGVYIYIPVSGSSGTFTDVRDNKIYNYVKIGSQYWMAENLNYAASGKCYGENSRLHDDESETYIEFPEEEILFNCETFGFLYDWDTAMAVCPDGWHIPNDSDWNALMVSVGDSSTAGKFLKAANNWNNNVSISDQNAYGFSALPGGRGGYSTDGFNDFNDLGDFGYWWSSSNSGAYWSINNSSDAAVSGNDDRNSLFSVRCLQD
ncbi:hypothetical protein R83H12_01400 [Fibrobacteria bacterium R8-3-H12]